MTDTKNEAILDAAFSVFVRYGFKRSTMGDVAEAAGLSRPALYTRFRNKEALFHAVAEAHIRRAIDQAIAALSGDAPVHDRVLIAFARRTGDFLAVFKHSAHGRELLDTNDTLAGDVIQEAHETFRAALVDSLERARSQEGLRLERAGLDAEAVATLLIDAANGVKSRLADAEEFNDRMTHLLHLLDAATRDAAAAPWVPTAAAPQTPGR